MSAHRLTPLFLSVLSLLVSLLVAEGSLFLLDRYPRSELGVSAVVLRTGKDVAEVSEYSDNLLVHKRNSESIHNLENSIPPPENKSSVRYKINSLRTRGDEFSLSKPRNVFRILMLGDSVTFGLFLENENTFSFQVQERLNLSSEESRFEVLNSGFSTYNITNYIDFFRDYGRRFASDLVVINLSVNDCIGRTLLESDGLEMFRYRYDNGRLVPLFFPFPDSVQRLLTEHSRLYRGLNKELFLLLYGGTPRVWAGWYARYDWCQNELVNLVAQIKEQRAKILIVIHPAYLGELWWPPARNKESKVEQFIQKMALSTDERVFMLRPFFASRRFSPAQLGYDWIHPNITGNELIAEALTEEILDTLS